MDAAEYADHVRGFVGYLLKAPFKAIEWTGKGFVTAGALGSGIIVVSRLLVALEPTLMRYVAQYLPNYVFYFEKLMEWARMAALL